MSYDVDATTQVMRLDIPFTPKVMIVDDDELVLARLRELVSAAGFEVLTAASAGEALASLEKDFTPIIISDQNMLGMDGLTLCREVRARDWPGYVYIIILTIRDSEKDILAGLNAGADDYMSKRATPAHLMARLRTAKRVLALERSLRDAVEKKRHLAMTDALTGVYNRRYFLRHLNRELKRTQRFSGDLSILMIDIDHFKQVNDSYGHGIGDTVLRELTDHVGKCLRRETDWCARLGGEEFVVVLEGTKLAGARVFAEDLRASVANTPMVTAAGPIKVTVSIGIGGLESSDNRSAATVDSLIQQADANLYSSKQNGRDRVTSPHSNRGGVAGRSATILRLS
jgi:two-component system chemotaxis response regulator CheY